MDVSTAKYSTALEAAAGGAADLASETGSKAFRRFTASQIGKIKDRDPAAFAETQRVSLISAFIVSVFLQKLAPEDSSDASGTNLIDLRSDPPQWSAKMLDIVSPKLREKLCSATVDSFVLLVNIGECFQRRYGFSPSCRVVAGAALQLVADEGNRGSLRISGNVGHGLHVLEYCNATCRCRQRL
mmetsp:Transcript_35199/g.139842  ORF Transcript_35199/g.139842 Transcript_35199/m.139842 type:complete len:185 (-) Transcript_35199:950-1504(-)